MSEPTGVGGGLGERHEENVGIRQREKLTSFLLLPYP